MNRHPLQDSSSQAAALKVSESAALTSSGWMPVRNNTTAAGFIEWSDDGQDVSYKGVQLNMNHLKWFLQDQTRFASEQLSELLLLPDCEDDTWARFIPKPALSRTQDDPNRIRARESFLDDPTNKHHLVQRHPRFLL
jgi:hypothetical protein